MPSTTFSLAGLSFRLDAPPSAPAPCSSVEYRPFLVTDTPQANGGHYQVRSPESPELQSADAMKWPVTWANDTWRLARDPVTCTSAITIFDALSRNWRHIATLAEDFGAGFLAAHGAGNEPVWYHPHDRAIITARLAHLGGGVVHAGAIVHGKNVILVSGPSGAGKTTLCRLCHDAGATLLNDERSIVHNAGGRYLAGSSPWHGIDNRVSPLSGPLTAIYFIRHGTGTAIEPLTPAHALTRLFTATMVPSFLPGGVAMVLNSWSRLVEEVPAFDLAFTPDHAAAAAMLSHAAGLSAE